MTRKINPDNRYGRQEDLFAEAYGPLTNENTEWTNEQIDVLLNGFLNGLRYLSSRDCLRRVTGRSQAAVSGMLWKLAVNYDRPSARNYDPVHRVCDCSRAGTPFTVRDKAVIEWASSEEGVRNKAHDPKYMAKILGRTEDEVMEFYASCVLKYECDCDSGFTKKSVKRPIPTEIAIRWAVKGSAKRLSEEIGL